MSRRINNSPLVQKTINAIVAEKTESTIWEEFLQLRRDEIETMFQNYLRDLAFERLKGSKEILSQTTEDMPFTTKVKAVLIANGITDVKSLISHSYMDLSHLNNLGRVSLQEIEDYVKKVGFSLATK